MTEREALKLALEALEDIKDDCSGCEFEWSNDYPLQAKAKLVLEEALAKREHGEPVALVEKFSLLLWDYQELELAFEKATGGKWIRKSNTPQRTWVGLTDDEMTECIVSICNTDDGTGDTRDLIRAVEAKLKEKNT